MDTGRLYMGIDPGTSHIGIATILVMSDGSLAFVRGKTLAPSDIRPGMFAYAKAFEVSAVGIEMPEGRNGSGGIKYLSPTAVIAGLLGGLCMATGIEVVWMYPRHWRKIVVGKGAVKDAAVADGLARYIELPRTNNHVRDAIGVAMATVWKHMYGEDIGNGMEAVHGKG